MIRTFQSRVDKVMVMCCLLPSTVLAVYFFWIRLPLAALLFLLAMVFIVERLIHTTYTFTDKGELHISKGRFARRETVALREVEHVEICRSGWFRTDVVVITCAGGCSRSVTPMAMEEFCHVLLKRKSELCKDDSLAG
ncbi:MAG: hypothetical protein K2N13_03725 [Paraprevotella sp.]|nr:hypothetical protein [Paraprevotella sp.]